MINLIQAATSPVITLGLKDWIELGMVIVAISSVYWRLTNKVNGFGERVNSVELLAAQTKILVEKITVQSEVILAERAAIRERLAGLEILAAGIKEELAEERMAVMTTLHNNERAAAERDAGMREELAKLTERIDIPQMIKTIMAERK